MSQATLKCIDTAEKILKCLSDNSIFAKYSDIKKKYLALETKTSRAQNHLKLVTLKNRELIQKRDELLNLTNKNDVSLAEWSKNYIRKLQIQTYPPTEQSIRPPETFDEACEQLTDIIIAKQKASDEYRNQITVENSHYRDKISSENAKVSKTINELQQASLSLDHAFRKKKEEHQRNLERLQKQIDFIHQQYEDFEEENERIQQFISDKESEQETKALQYQMVMAKKKKAKQQLKSLRAQAERYQTKCNAKQQEIDEVRLSQRFGISTADPDTIAHLQTIELQVAELLKTNERLSFEIKKRKYSQESDLSKLTSTSSITYLESSIH